MKKIMPISKEELAQYPADVQGQVYDTLKAFNDCNIVFYDGEYHVSTSTALLAKYPKDHKTCGYVYKDDVYTEEEQMVNYIETFHDYPYGYKGKRDYQALKGIGNNWGIKFKMVDGNLVLA